MTFCFEQTEDLIQFCIFFFCLNYVKGTCISGDGGSYNMSGLTKEQLELDIRAAICGLIHLTCNSQGLKLGIFLIC